MDSFSIELPGSQIASIRMEGDCLCIHFARAIIIKTMTGSRERTRWWQEGDLVIEGVEWAADLPEGPLVCAGGDIEDNVFTYRDMIPLPLASRGRMGCDLAFANFPLRLQARGTAMRLEMLADPKYIEHLRPT